MNSPFVSWLLGGFSVVIVVINAALSFAFGASYLGAAFSVDGWLQPVIGGLYALLIADVAFVVWFWSYRRIAETQQQRQLSLAVAVLALSVSVAMTITQLSANAFGLVDLSDYQESVGLVALVLMIAVTAALIVSVAAFALMTRSEQVKTRTMNHKALLLQESMDAMDASMLQLKDQMVIELSERLRGELIAELGLDVLTSGEEVAEAERFRVGVNGAEERE
jgi:hypothetical protein